MDLCLILTFKLDLNPSIVLLELFFNRLVLYLPFLAKEKHFGELGGQRPRLGRSSCQNPKVVRSRAAPARLVDGGLDCLVLRVLWYCFLNLTTELYYLKVA